MSDDEKEIVCKLFDIHKWIPEFLIDDARRAALCFRETLMICSKNEFGMDTKPIGGYCVLAESIGPQARELLVQVQSSMSIDGHFGGTKVISSATSKFHCLEEKRTEFVYEDNGLHEKTIFIGIEDDFYHIKLTRTCPCDKSTETKDLSFCCGSKLISEGINVLLMRYLALTNYEGTLSFESISIDGDITMSNYSCTPCERMELDGQFLCAYTIERKMHKEDGTVHTIKTYLTPKGRILRHNWLDVPYLLKINPLIDPNVPMKSMKVETPLRERWSEDIEMFSKYLDTKYSKISEQMEYLADHPEVKQLIADYIQTLLVGKQFHNWINIVPTLLRQVTLMKPENVIEFTIQHFKAFAREPIAWETSELDENYDVDVKSQLAREKSDVVCGVCGFRIDSSVLGEVSSRSLVEESPESPRDSMQSIRSEDSRNTARDIQEKNDTSTSNTSESDICIKTPYNMPDALLQLKRTCDQCETTVRICHEQQPNFKRPECLKVFNMCTKCSVIDQILQRLKK